MSFDNLHLHLNFSAITSRSKSMQLSCGAVCYMLLCLILYLCVYLPLKTQLRHNAILITELTTEFNDKQQRMSAEKSTTKNQPTETIELNKLQPQRLSHLLTQLVALANVNHLEFETIKPLPQESVHHVQIQPIQISTSGHYQQLLDFFSQLPRLDVINALGDFSIKPLLPSTGGHVPKILQLTLILNLYSKAKPP